jgi:hypothetical protein
MLSIKPKCFINASDFLFVLEIFYLTTIFEQYQIQSLL